MTEQKDSIVIIGAGFAGLSAAYDLAKAGLKVTILENLAKNYCFFVHYLYSLI